MSAAPTTSRIDCVTLSVIEGHLEAARKALVLAASYAKGNPSAAAAVNASRASLQATRGLFTAAHKSGGLQ